MTALEALLEVQEHDTAVDRLRHRRTHLPERAELAAATAKGAEVMARLADARIRREEVLGRQAGLEASIASADARITEMDGRLYSGQITATRDILAMTAEIESLKARRSSLEDEVLATMEEDEPLASDVSRLEAELAAVEEEADRLRKSVAASEREIDLEATAVAEARKAVAARVSGDLLATYEKLRASLGGVGAARLVGQSCTGCHLTLPAQEVARIKRAPPDALMLCEQCGRILVP